MDSAYIEKCHCIHCGSKSLAETSHEIVCTNCGCVLQDRMCVEEPVWNQTVLSSNDDEAPVLASTSGIPQDVFQLAEFACSTLGLHESVSFAAMQLYKRFAQACSAPIRGNNRRLIVYAFVFYAQRDIRVGARTRDEFCSLLGLEPSLFCKAIGIAKDFLYQQEDTKHLVGYRENHDDTLHRLVMGCTDIPTDKMQDVKKTVHKLFSRIGQQNSTNELWASVQVEKTNAAFIYMSCRLLNIKTTMSHIAACCNTSMATIIKIENMAKAILATTTA